MTITDRPCAAPGLTSYRYHGRFGWIMIGAKNDTDALAEAARSIDGVPVIANLEIWHIDRYVPVLGIMK